MLFRSGITVGSAISLLASTGAITAASGNFGGVSVSSAGIDMAGKPITNLQSGGITSTDSSAVSGSAVYDYLQSNYATSANTGYTVNVRDGSSTSTFRVANNGAISYVAGDNVELSGENGSVTIGMSLTPVFTSATFGTAGSGTTIGSTGVTLSNGAFFTTEIGRAHV